jgi:hypothetical protein
MNELTRFQFDDLGPVWAFDNGERTPEGWCVPRFNRVQAEALCAMMAADEGVGIEWDDEVLVIILEGDFDGHHFTSRRPHYPVRESGEDFYLIGAGTWEWERLEARSPILSAL